MQTPAVVERAYQFYRAWTYFMGDPPRVFPVTWEEYRSLKRWSDPAGLFVWTPDEHANVLFGMRVVLVDDAQWPMAPEPTAPRRVDSERSSLEEWAAGVDALVRDVRGPECSR